MLRAVLVDRCRVVIEDVPVPRPGPGEILLRNLVTGICRTDRKCFSLGQRDLAMPRVLGHENVGVIHELGDGVTGHSVGDRVVVHPGVSCGTCPDCRAGTDQICRLMRIVGFHVDGGFAEYSLVPAAAVARGVVQPVPDGLAPEFAALFEPLACAINLAERVRFAAGESVLLVGGGVLGWLFATLAGLLGVSDVVVLEREPSKRELLGRLPVQVHDTEIDDADLLGAREAGFDVAIACCPGTDAFARCLRVARRRGRVGSFSGLTADDPIDARTLNRIHYAELAVLGTYGCGMAHTRAALDLLHDRPDRFELPTRFVSLAEVPEVLAATETRDTVVTAIRFQ